MHRGAAAGSRPTGATYEPRDFEQLPDPPNLLIACSGSAANRAPRPPPLVGTGPPSAQRRSALEFLGRELRTLEMEASHSQYLEERLEAVQAELAEARKACEVGAAGF